MDNRYVINSSINNLQKYNLSYTGSGENIIKHFNSNYNDNNRLMNVKLTSKQKNISKRNCMPNSKNDNNNIKNDKCVTSINSQIKALQEIKYKLENILSAAGYENININFKYGSTHSTINFNTYESNKNKYEHKIKEGLDNL